MKRVHIATIVVLLGAPALAGAPVDPPLPPPRPKFEAPAKAPEPEAKPPAAAGVCAAMQSGRIIGATVPEIPGENGCGVANPVRVTGVKLRSGLKLKLKPDAVLNCEMAGELADFLDEEAGRLEAAGQGRLVEVQQAGAYECRGRNRVPGATLSEHASGNAIDLRTFKFADGHAIVIGGASSPTWAGVKLAACARFKTVLGPGSDDAHKDNLHLDMRARKSTTICQWTVD